jgi:ubiquinone/menaquinone biosynthesis C-methylase UbiE
VSPKKAGISSGVCGARFLGSSREIYRRLLKSKPWVKQMHSSFLGLRPGMKIVDVGCGTGDFSRHLAGLIPGKCDVVGVDISGANIRIAEKQTEEERMGDRITFRKGDAYNIPVEDGWADLVCCRYLLMHLSDPLKAVREMSRVARREGTVAAFERGRLQSICIPDDDKLTKLAIRLGESYNDGVRKLEGKYFDIGNRLPNLFQRAGLREIRAEVEAHPFLASDPRRKLKDRRNELEFHLATFKEEKKLTAKAMLAGGATKARIDQYSHWLETWMTGLLEHDQRLENEMVFTTAGLGGFNTGGQILVSGRKITSG